MKPTFDTLLKCIQALLMLLVFWSWLQPERFIPRLHHAALALFFVLTLLGQVYRNRTNKGPGPGGTAQVRPEEE